MSLLALACFTALSIFASAHQMLPYVAALHGIMWLLIGAGFITDRINDNRFLRSPMTSLAIRRYFSPTVTERWIRMLFPIVAIVSIAAPLAGS